MPSVSINSAFSPVQTDKAFYKSSRKERLEAAEAVTAVRDGTGPAAAAMHQKQPGLCATAVCTGWHSLSLKYADR